MPDKNISCILVDDEEQAHFILKHFISLLDFVTLKGAFLNAMDAYAHLRKEHVDLILLDVNMPEVNGFSLLEMLEKPPMVIITTAQLEHAYTSFEYNAIDYLHKPIRFERFVAAIEKAVKWKQVHVEQTNIPGYIEIKADGYVQQIPVADILYIESLGNYIKIYLPSRSVITFSTTKDVEDMLKGSSCVRIHKSYIVNTDAVTELQSDSLLIAQKVLPVGKTYKKHLEYLWDNRNTRQ